MTVTCERDNVDSDEELDMSTATSTIQELANREYKYGFVTDIEADYRAARA